MKNILKNSIVLASVAVALYSLPSVAVSQSRQQLAQGQKLYMSYCASCHGADGSGNLARVSTLSEAPPDLRRIQLRYGRFASDEIRAKIMGNESLPVHRKGKMPVWGMILRTADINQMVAWLRTIQRPFDPAPAE